MLSTLNLLKCKIDFWSDHYTVLSVSSITLQRLYNICIFTFIYEGSVWKTAWLWTHDTVSEWDCYLVSSSISSFCLLIVPRLNSSCFFLPFLIEVSLKKEFCTYLIWHIRHAIVTGTKINLTLYLQRDLIAVQSSHFSGWQGQDDTSHSLSRDDLVDFDKSCGHTQFSLTLC